MAKNAINGDEPLLQDKEERVKTFEYDTGGDASLLHMAGQINKGINKME